MKELISKIPKDKRTFAKKLIDEIEFQRTTIEELKSDITKNGAIVKMENGSQKMTIQSPAFKGYTTLVTRYNATLKQLADLLPSDEIEETDELLDFIK